MLKCGLSIVAPQHIGEEFLSKWFSLYDSVIESMLQTVSQKFYGKRVFPKSDIISKVEKALKWEEILDKLGKTILEKIGLLWFFDEQLEIEDEGEKAKILMDLIDFKNEEIEKIEKTLEEVERSYVIFPF